LARSDDTTRTKVTLHDCNFGSAEEASLLLAAFRINRTVTFFPIRRIGAAFGAGTSGLMQNMTQLRTRLESAVVVKRGGDGVRTVQPTLQTNRTNAEAAI
jgi:hypothetical protein